MPCGSERDGPLRHGQSHGPSRRRSPTAAAAAGPCESQPPFNGHFGVARAEVEPVLPRARPLVPAAAGQGAHRSSEYSSTRLRVSFVGSPQCHAAVYTLRFHVPCLRHGVMAPSATVVCFRPTAPAVPEHLGSTVLSALCTMRGGRPSGPRRGRCQQVCRPHFGRSHLGRFVPLRPRRLRAQQAPTTLFPHFKDASTFQACPNQTTVTS